LMKYMGALLFLPNGNGQNMNKLWTNYDTVGVPFGQNISDHINWLFIFSY
jgi:hypothetical protein